MGSGASRPPQPQASNKNANRRGSAVKRGGQTKKTTTTTTTRVITKTSTTGVKTNNRVVQSTKKQTVEFSSIDDKSPVQKPPGYEEAKLKKEIDRKKRRYVIVSNQ